MIILIDGYNLLKQQDPGAYIEESVREHFIRVLGAYRKRRGHLIMLIFDGGSQPWPVQELKMGIMVIYAGAGKSADDFIKQYIAEHHAEDLFLVSSDRELGLWASKYDFPSMNSLPFYDIITSGLAADIHNKRRLGEVVKTTTREDYALDALMLEASERIVPKQEDEQREKKRAQRQESKIDRLLRKKIEKL